MFLGAIVLASEAEQLEQEGPALLIGGVVAQLGPECLDGLVSQTVSRVPCPVSRGFEGAPDDYYTGINAAAKSVFLGTPADLAKAAEYAARVQKIVGETPKANDYWWTATVGEVFLIRRMFDDAARLYDAAVSMAPSETGSHKSTWQQVCRLMEKLQPAPAERARIREPFSHLPDCATAAASKP